MRERERGRRGTAMIVRNLVSHAGDEVTFIEHKLLELRDIPGVTVGSSGWRKWMPSIPGLCWG